MEVLADQFDELLSTLKTKGIILVGHNLFLDLIYFFTCFFGCLPARVEGFQTIVAQVFPLVFDTKYLADKINDNSPLYKSSLDEIDQELSKLPIPTIGTFLAFPTVETHPDPIIDQRMQRPLLSIINMTHIRQSTKPALIAS